MNFKMNQMLGFVTMVVFSIGLSVGHVFVPNADAQAASGDESTKKEKALDEKSKPLNEDDVDSEQNKDEQGRATAFRAVEGSEQEQVSGSSLFFGAYTVFFLFLMILVFRIRKISAENRAQLEQLVSEKNKKQS